MNGFLMEKSKSNCRAESIRKSLSHMNALILNKNNWKSRAEVCAKAIYSADIDKKWSNETFSGSYPL